MSNTPTVDQVLAEAAKEVEAAGKVRKPKADAKPREPKAPKEKKPKLYKQWNEDGTPQLDAEGNQVMGETKMLKPRVAKQPKLDADGNPIARSAKTSIPDGATLSKTDKEAKFREGTSRHTNYHAITDGMTAKDYFEATGGRAVTSTFLVWYIKEGYVALGDAVAD